jgi:Ca2+-binding EF-hand superfamily protein
MKMKKLRHSLLFSLLISASALSIAQTPIPDRGPIPFNGFDLNGDGAISQQEFDSIHAQRQAGPGRGRMSPPAFESFDLNGDQQLSPEELAAGQRKRMIERRGMGPGNRQGPGQGAGRNMPKFIEFDLNGDGVVQETELEQARAERIRQRAMLGYQMRNLRYAPTFKEIDSNGDGVISQEEFSTAQQKHRQRIGQQ